MSDIEKKIKLLREDINKLIDKEINENSAILSIYIGTPGGTFLASGFKEELKISGPEAAAASSSLLFLSSKLLNDSMMQEISYNLVTGKDKVILSVMTEQITMSSFLNRELAELEGLDDYISKMNQFALQISAFVETSDIIKEEIFVSIKRAIPSALMIGILTKEGMPIKIQSTMPEPTISAMISAIYNLSDLLLEESELEYSIIAGSNGSIIMHELDESRLLFIAVPEADEGKLGTYIAKIKSVIQ